MTLKKFWVRGKFATFCVLIQGLMVVLFALFVDYDDNAHASNKYKILQEVANLEAKHGKEAAMMKAKLDLDMNDRVNSMLTDSTMYIVAGFGIIFTFLRRYGYSGVGLNLLLCTLVFQWATLCQGFFASTDGIIKTNVVRMWAADGTAATILISWGAVLGKTSPLQALILAFLEVPLAATNEWITTKVYMARDPGGSMLCHVFSTYFGLGAALVLFRPEHNEDDEAKQSSTYNSDIVSTIGAVILWVYWPSLLAGGMTGDARHRAMINAYYAMAGSSVASFAISSLLNKDSKFTMGHIQNASLAGGVAIGSTVNLMVGPYGALLIGVVGAVITVLGMEYTAPFIRDRLRMHDTCGINNLHGMTGVFGGLAGAVMACRASEANYGPSLYEIYPAMAPKDNTTSLLQIQQWIPGVVAGDDRTPMAQAAYQMMALVTSFFLSLIGGVLVGMLLRLSFFDPPSYDQLFDDTDYWRLPGEVDDDMERNFYMSDKPDEEHDSKEFIQMAEQMSKNKLDDGENPGSAAWMRNRSKSVPAVSLMLPNDDDTDLLRLVATKGRRKSRGFKNLGYDQASEA